MTQEIPSLLNRLIQHSEALTKLSLEPWQSHMMIPQHTQHTFYSFHNHSTSQHYPSTSYVPTNYATMVSLSMTHHSYTFHLMSAPHNTTQSLRNHHTNHYTSHLKCMELHPTSEVGNLHEPKLNLMPIASMYI